MYATNMWPTSVAALRAALEVVYSTQDIWAGLPYVIITAAVSTVGVVLWFLFTSLLEYVLLPDQRRRQAIIITDPQKRHQWVWRPWRVGANTLQFLLKIVFMVGLGFIIWIAGASAGFNPWTTAVASMGIMVLVTYTFITPLGLWGVGVALDGSNAINVGEYWEFHGMPGWDGLITGKYAFEVEMMRLNDAGETEIISIPNSMWMQATRKQNPTKAAYAKRAFMLQGEHKWAEVPAPTVAQRSVARTSGKTGQAAPAQAAVKINHRLQMAPELLLV